MSPKSSGQLVWPQVGSHRHLWAAAGQVGGYANPGLACMFGVCWLLTGVRWPQLFSMWLLLLQQASPGLLSLWRQGSKRECGIVQVFVRLKLRAVSLLPCSLGQPKLQVTAQILRGAAKSHYKRCAYREGWKIQVIFVIDLLYYLKSFQFHQEVIKKNSKFLCAQ